MNHFVKKWFIFLAVSCYVPVFASVANPWHYDERYYDLAQQSNSDVGILLITYNRPEYLQQVVDALEKTPQAATLPFVFVLDGGPLATQEQNKHIIENAQINHKFILVRPTNYGCGRSIIDARRFMFEWCKFKKIVLFEDDLVINPDYITVVLKLHEWARNNYDDVGVVQCFNKCFLSLPEKKEMANAVYEMHGSFWGYCMDDLVYYAIKGMLDEFEDKYLINFPHDQSNCKALAEWFSQLLAQHRKPIVKCAFPTNINHELFFQHIVEKLNANYVAGKRRNAQDFEMRLALFINGYKKIATVVNRAKYIGKVGVHSTSNGWYKRFYDQIELDTLKHENKLQEFVPLSPLNEKRRPIVFDFQTKRMLSHSWLLEILKENNYPFKIICKQPSPIPAYYYDLSHNIILSGQKIDKQAVFVVPILLNRDVECLRKLSKEQRIALFVISKRNTLRIANLAPQIRNNVFTVIIPDKAFLSVLLNAGFKREQISIWSEPQDILTSLKQWSNVQ